MRPGSAITLRDVAAAAARVQPLLRRTPMLTVEIPTPTGRQQVSLKLESLQVTGSFKPRGALNSLMQIADDEVVACSGGNHGLAVAWAADALGKRATVVVPTSAARSKVAAMRRLGAEVVEHGDTPGEAFAYADSIVARRAQTLIHPYDQVATVAGQGSMGLELAEDAPHVTHWMVAVGGGGLLAGLVIALDGIADVVPVEPAGCPALFRAQQEGGPVDSPATGLARTSLGAPSIGAIPWSVVCDAVVGSTLVSDDSIVGAQTWMWEHLRLVAEPGGAAALAALREGAWTPPAGAVVGVVVCGGNADALPPASP